mmetsp:Transcript_14904/g.37547  ORF Transcript_14904/g.37547 Transcript_14904/m.37547 type:complete len:90 (-) Transcript_14904:1161-1430(-)
MTAKLMESNLCFHRHKKYYQLHFQDPHAFQSQHVSDNIIRPKLQDSSPSFHRITLLLGDKFFCSSSACLSEATYCTPGRDWRRSNGMPR